MTERTTKRKYAHELYPHAEEGQTRPLVEEVPYLYARAIGYGISGTNWSKAEPPTIGGDRVMMWIECIRIALMADAMLQGMTGQEAWEWADQRAWDESASCMYERAVDHYGIDYYAIKPYPCGPEPEHHDHYGPEDARGFRTVHRQHIPESACEECTEPIHGDGSEDAN